LSAFWWELMEMLRKFLLIGLFVTVEPGTILQVTIGTVVSAAYVVRAPVLDGLPLTFVRNSPLILRISHGQMIQLKAQPYKNLMECVMGPDPLLPTIRLTRRSVGRVPSVQRRAGASGKLVPAHVLPLLPDLQV
jgi:hypothetical protein